MTHKEAIEFGKDRADLFGGKMSEFIKLSLEALEEQEEQSNKTVHDILKELSIKMVKTEVEEASIKINGLELINAKVNYENIDLLRRENHKTGVKP